MNTNNVDSFGNEYQLGNVYEFCDREDQWWLRTLFGVETEQACGYAYIDTSGVSWKCIREVKTQHLGTIKKTLVDGGCYQFICRDGYLRYGVYGDRAEGRFEVPCGKHEPDVFKADVCTQVIRLIPEDHCN